MSEDTVVTATHLLWAGRWLAVTKDTVNGEPAWRFSNGRDAADWLAYHKPDPPLPNPDPED